MRNENGEREHFTSLEKLQLLHEAEKHCLARGARLTPSRRQVLSLVIDYPDVVKAYDVLKDLQKIKKNAAPPTVYRALDFFVEMGILHRAESLNGFVFCPHFSQEHSSIILSCSQCGKVCELAADKQIQALINFCQVQGFALVNSPLVLNGWCKDCQEEEI